MKIDHIVTIAKKFLRKQPYDVAHGLEHHRSVWELGKKIAKAEKIKADMDAFTLAAWWHDVVVSDKKVALNQRDVLTKETCDYLMDLLNQEAFESEVIDKVITAIQNHSFECKPKIIETKLLWDADKLEGLNMVRWANVLEDYKSGRMSQKNFNLYIGAVKVWLRQM